MTRLPILAAALGLMALPVAVPVAGPAHAQGLLTLSTDSARMLAAAAKAAGDTAPGPASVHLGGALGDTKPGLTGKLGGLASSVVGDGSPDQQGLTDTLCALMPASEGCVVAKK